MGLLVKFLNGLEMAVGNLKGTPIIIGGAAEQGVSEQTAMTNCINTGAQECRILMPEGCSLP